MLELLAGELGGTDTSSGETVAGLETADLELARGGDLP